MAARRNTRGRRRNRGRFGFLYALLSFLLIAAALVGGSIVFFRVDTIQVTGNLRYSAQEIIAATQVEIRDNLFTVNGRRVAKRIYSQLPYIRSVSVRHALPDSLVIQVTESHPAASIQGPEGWFLLDTQGKLVEQGPEALRSKAAPITGLTLLAPTVGTKMAVDQTEQIKLDSLVALLSALEGQGLLEQLTSLDVTPPSTLLFGYGHRFTVEIPLSSDFDYKVQVLAYVVTQLAENETGLIDLTRTDAHFIPSEALSG